MSFLPMPDVIRSDIYKISPALFLERGIKLVMLDVDNTIAPYTDDRPTPELLRWAGEMRKAGLELFILSNNHGSRPEIFASALQIEYVRKARKPFPQVMRREMRRLGVPPGETALVGDQIYTDALCAKLCGAMSVVVRPIQFSNPLLAVRFGLEFPFRAAYKLVHRGEN